MNIEGSNLEDLLEDGIIDDLLHIPPFGNNQQTGQRSEITGAFQNLLGTSSIPAPGNLSLWNDQLGAQGVLNQSSFPAHNNLEHSNLQAGLRPSVPLDQTDDPGMLGGHPSFSPAGISNLGNSSINPANHLQPTLSEHYNLGAPSGMPSTTTGQTEAVCEAPKTGFTMDEAINFLENVVLDFSQPLEYPPVDVMRTNMQYGDTSTPSERITGNVQSTSNGLASRMQPISHQQDVSNGPAQHPSNWLSLTSANEQTFCNAVFQQTQPSAPEHSECVTDGPTEIRNEFISSALGEEYNGNYTDDLLWISTLLEDVAENFTQTADLYDPALEANAATQESRNELQRPISQLPPDENLRTQSVGSLRAPDPEFRKLLGRKYRKRAFEGRLRGGRNFLVRINRMRAEGASLEDIEHADAIADLPSLDAEMAFNSPYQGSESVSWHIKRSDSPTISRISQFVRPSARGTVVRVETLFNYLFRLSRNSFLQREEMVHANLILYFLEKIPRGNKTRFESDVKELIIWMESNFARHKLAEIMDRLVCAIDKTIPVTLLVRKANLLYKKGNRENAVVRAFQSLLNEQNEAAKSKQLFTQRKKEANARIKQVRSTLQNMGVKVPRCRYDKKGSGRGSCSNQESGQGGYSTQTDQALGRMFSTTRGLLVECTDSHYVYARCVRNAAKILRSEAEAKRNQRIATLNGYLSLPGQVTDGVISAARVAERVRMINEIGKEKKKDMNVLEKTMLDCFYAATLALGRVSVRGLLRTVGKMPRRLAHVVQKRGEELEKCRGIGCGVKLGIEEIVRMSEIVARESAMNVKQREVLERKQMFLNLLSSKASEGSGFGR